MFKADGSRRDFPVVKPRIIVGRTNDCDLRIPLSSVSRQHCEFRLEGNQFKLHDLGSSNGTFRNNTRIATETLLQAGDEIVIGPVVFTVVIDGKPATIDPVRTVLDRNRASVNGGQSEATSVVEPQRHSYETGVEMPSLGGTKRPMPTPQPQPKPKANVDPDDPIAALEALANSSDDTRITGDDDDDLIPVLDEEDEDLPILAQNDDEDEDDDLQDISLSDDDDDDDIPMLLDDDDDDDK